MSYPVPAKTYAPSAYAQRSASSGASASAAGSLAFTVTVSRRRLNTQTTRRPSGAVRTNAATFSGASVSSHTRSPSVNAGSAARNAQS